MKSVRKERRKVLKKVQRKMLGMRKVTENVLEERKEGEE